MKSRIVLPLVGIVSALVLIAAVVFRPLPTTITRENAAKIQVGMNYTQVVDILGEMRDEIRGSKLPDIGGMVSIAGVAEMSWRSETTGISVVFQKGRVTQVEVDDTKFPSTAAYLDWRVRRSLGLPMAEPVDEPDEGALEQEIK